MLCFSHDIYHEGEMFNGKSKYLMRSDVMYKRQKAADTQPPRPEHHANKDEAIARAKLAAAEEAEAKGEMSKATDLYRQAFKLAPHLEFERV